MTELSSEEIEFLKDHKDLLKSNNFSEFFKLARKHVAYNFSNYVDFFIDCGITYEEILSDVEGVQGPFFYYKDLKEVTIPHGVKFLDSAFVLCNIEKVNIPDSADDEFFRITNTPFRNCKIDEIVLPEKFKNLPKDCIHPSTKLTYY